MDILQKNIFGGSVSKQDAIQPIKKKRNSLLLKKYNIIHSLKVSRLGRVIRQTELRVCSSTQTFFLLFHQPNWLLVQFPRVLDSVSPALAIFKSSSSETFLSRGSPNKYNIYFCTTIIISSNHHPLLPEGENAGETKQRSTLQTCVLMRKLCWRRSATLFPPNSLHFFGDVTGNFH